MRNWSIQCNIVENNIFNKILNSTYYKNTILQALTKLYIMCIDGRVSAQMLQPINQGENVVLTQVGTYYSLCSIPRKANYFSYCSKTKLLASLFKCYPWESGQFQTFGILGYSVSLYPIGKCLLILMLNACFERNMFRISIIVCVGNY